MFIFKKIFRNLIILVIKIFCFLVNTMLYKFPLFVFTYVFQSKVCILALDKSKQLILINFDKLQITLKAILININNFYSQLFILPFKLLKNSNKIIEKLYYFIFYFFNTLSSILKNSLAYLIQLLVFVFTLTICLSLCMVYLFIFLISIKLLKIIIFKFIPLVIINFLSVTLYESFFYFIIVIKCISTLLKTLYYLLALLVHIPIFNWFWSVYYQFFLPRKKFNAWIQENRFPEKYRILPDDILSGMDDLSSAILFKLRLRLLKVFIFFYDLYHGII